MTAVEKSARDKANPTGEARAAKLIAWFNAGAGGKIVWGKPGAFDACVRVAGKHMTTNQAEGFCATRYHDVTGEWPGRRKGKVTKAGRLAVLRRLLSLHPATKTECPSCGEAVSAFAGSCPSCGTVVGMAAKALGMKTSAMVALYPSPDVARAMALDGGELPESLHVTLGFLGSDAVVRLGREKIEEALRSFAAVNAPVAGVVGGLARFTPVEADDPWPLVALIDAPGLTEFRQRLVGALAAAGVEVAANHGYTPHCTLALVGPEDDEAATEILAAGVPRTPLHFGSIVLAWGDDRYVFTLDSMRTHEPEHHLLKATAGPVIKSDESRRYTLMPLYPASPDAPSAAHLDAHGDFATADDVQASVWDYVRTGDRTIRDQHRDGTAIGEWVELMCWPHEVTVPLTKTDGTTVQKTFGAGTAFMGVIWSDTGWEDVKKGRKTGLSLGGAATRIAVEMNG